MTQTINSREVIPQELSIQWLDLQRTKKYIKLKNLTETSLGDVAQKVVDTYNKEKEDEKSQTRYKLQETPSHDERNYQLKVYSYRVARVTSLSQKVQTHPKKTSNSLFLLFFYKEEPIKRMIAVTSGQAWSVVRHCTNYEFPIRVAEKVANAERIVEIARIGLFNKTKETLLHPAAFELNKTQSLYYLVESFKSRIKPNSSLSNLVGSCCIKITTGGLLRIEKRIPFEEYPPLLDLFSQYVEGEKTYNREGNEEITDPLFQFLNFLQPAQLIKKSLDICLITQMYKAYRHGQAQLIYVRHKLFEDFIFSNRFELKIDADFKPFGSSPPEIEAIIDELDASDEEIFREKVLACKLRFYDKDNHPQQGLLVDCLEGEVRLSNGGTYFKVRGMWYKIAADYLGLVHEDFKTVLKDALIPQGAEGWLPRPWKGNHKGGKVTQDLVKATLEISKGIQKFMKELKATRVYYVEGTHVRQPKLVGEILKNKSVLKHKDAIEKILKEGFSDQKIRDVCSGEGDAVLEALKRERKVVEEQSNKETYVLNPFPYPMKARAELKGKYDLFVGFLEELYIKSESSEDEETYNRAYLQSPYGLTQGYLVFDQICPDNIEPCDILKYTTNTVYLYHVKEKFGQHTRDACSQILNSAKMIRSALSTHQPQNYLQKLWDKATNLGKTPSEWLKSVKAQVEELEEKDFLKIFRNRKIVFVYAYLPDEGKTFFDESKAKSFLSPEDLKIEEPDKIFAMLIELGYLDSYGRLTGKFHTIKKELFKLTGKFEASSEEVFKQLRLFRSLSKSTLAKLEILQLAQSLRALNFEFKITEIPKANEGVASCASSSSGTLSATLDVDDEDDDMDDLEFSKSTGSVPVSMPVSKIESGPIGYQNIGNACYMIASIQVLFNIADFRQLATQKKNSSSLTQALYNLLQITEPDKTGSTILDLRDEVFKMVSELNLKNTLEDGGENRKTAQHDAQEFFNFILDQLNWPTFKTCTVFKEKSKRLRRSKGEEHLMLSLALQGATFQEVIDAYFSFEEMGDAKNKKQQRPQMTIFPDFLFIQLKRFTKEGKDSKEILFPIDGAVNIEGKYYEIIGFVNHHGLSAESGHYTADIKNLRDVKQEQWIRCNDSDLKEDKFIDPPKKAYLIALRKKK